SLYCDRADSKKRRACRTVLDILHRCLTAWLAPALPFTAEEAWVTRFGDDASVHLTLFPEIPAGWQNEALAETWNNIRTQRSAITGAIEAMRRDKTIGSSLQAVAVIAAEAKNILADEDMWADICITSGAVFGDTNGATTAPGTKCERCWRVLPEVGSNKNHPTLCIRCCEAVG
ncbi:MAG: isoleucine--tRNA ligase, partial [Acidocella sp. 21-58-7]